MKPLTIGDLARSTGITVEAIRYYEAQKLLEKPTRSISGYRQYSTNVVRRLNFICKAKDLGFSLSDIRDLLHLRTKTTESCAQVKNKADIKIHLIQAKIRELERLETALLSLSESCSKNILRSGKCPILDLLDVDEREKNDEN